MSAIDRATSQISEAHDALREVRWCHPKHPHQSHASVYAKRLAHRAQRRLDRALIADADEDPCFWDALARDAQPEWAQEIAAEREAQAREEWERELWAELAAQGRCLECGSAVTDAPHWDARSQTLRLLCPAGRRDH